MAIFNRPGAPSDGARLKVPSISCGHGSVKRSSFSLSSIPKLNVLISICTLKMFKKRQTFKIDDEVSLENCRIEMRVSLDDVARII